MYFYNLLYRNKLLEMVKISTVKKDILLFLGTEGNKDVTNSQISSFLSKDEGNISKHLKDLRFMDFVVTVRKSIGRKTENFNNLTKRGMDVSREIRGDKEIKQGVINSQQVVNKLNLLSPKNLYDSDNINLRETSIPRSVKLLKFSVFRPIDFRTVTTKSMNLKSLRCLLIFPSSLLKKLEI